MTHDITIPSSLRPNIAALCENLSVPMAYESEPIGADGVERHWLWQPDRSTTAFLIAWSAGQPTTLAMDYLASMSDYRLFPYLADCLHVQLTGEAYPDIYTTLDEEWAATAIGDAVAYVKAHLVLEKPYFLSLPLAPLTYVDAQHLAAVAVNAHSATPRIYGYIQHLLSRQLLPTASEADLADAFTPEEEIEVDIPQHQSIGRVRSWHLDGEETWESFSQSDVEMLLALGEQFLHQGRAVESVVLNDLGTLFQEGVGVARDGERAAFWFREAIAQGETLYAPSNLGDLYRKGCAPLPTDLAAAYVAYTLGIAPYAHYRIGQAWEEGWHAAPDLDRAMAWYERAAQEGHHLALKRLGRNAPPSTAE